MAVRQAGNQIRVNKRSSPPDVLRMYNYHPPPIQTAVAINSHDPQENTARPFDSQVHSDALWFQPQQKHNATYEPAASRPLNPQEQDKLAYLDRLKFFLATAPSRWDTTSASNTSDSSNHSSPAHPALNRFLLPSQEFVTCVLWNGLYHITGTDIVRALVFRFEAFGRPVRNMKKFEEGVFSDLRNLKPGVDACLEEPKSPFLDLLFKYQCIRTQKKQKVFYWFSVPHDRLFLDALERDLKREKMGMEPTTVIMGEPALSFSYDPKRSLYDQFSKAQGGREGEGDIERVVRRLDEDSTTPGPTIPPENGVDDESSGLSSTEDSDGKTMQGQSLFSFTLFEGSPTYKQRRKKTTLKPSSLSAVTTGESEEQPARGRFLHRTPNASDSSPSMSAEPASRDPSPAPPANLSAADMFRKQARGELINGNGTIPSNRKRHSMIDPRHVGVYYEGVQGVNPIVTEIPGSACNYSSSSYWSASSDMVDMPGGALAPRGRSVDSRYRAPYVAVPQPSLSAGYADPSYDTDVPERSLDHYPTESSHSYLSTFPSSLSASNGVAKIHSCPLVTCGKQFKRMEHLKRHLRTHTLERPFVCPKCKKRFSRNDNLGQHLRVHDREGEEGIDSSTLIDSGGDASDMDDGVDSWVDYDAGERTGMLVNSKGEYVGYTGNESFGSGPSAYSPGQHQGHQRRESSGDFGLQEWINSESGSEQGEEEGSSEPRVPGSANASPASVSPPNTSHDSDGGMDTEEAFRMLPGTRAGGTDIGMSLNMFGGENGIGLGMGMRNVGIGMRQQQSPSDTQMSDSPSSSQGSGRGQWAMRTSSPAFIDSHPVANTSQSHQPTHSSSLPMMGMNPSMRGFAVSRQSSAGVYGTHLAQDDSQYLAVPSSYTTSGIPISISAPSHKQTFDHGSMYPPSTLFSEPSSLSASNSLSSSPTGSLHAAMGLGNRSSLGVDNAGGAVRRHRSMTPSLIRSDSGHGPIRRPGTANSVAGDFPPGTFDSGVQATPARGYHPYATSRAGSVHNSPMGGAHNMGLPSSVADAYANMGMGRSSSRSSLGVRQNSGGEISAEQHLSVASMERPGSSLSVSSNTSNPYGGEMYRTDSPSPFTNATTITPSSLTESPSPFLTDLPSTTAPYRQHASTAPPGLDMQQQHYPYPQQTIAPGDIDYTAFHSGQQAQHVSTL